MRPIAEELKGRCEDPRLCIVCIVCCQPRDTVDVHLKILEGNKERIQVFTGVVIARSGSGSREMFSVRRIVAGEGVERKFPFHSPRIEKVEVKRSGVVRRAKLYFLRDRVGKAVRLKERRRS